jgi:hypothetical protein
MKPELLEVEVVPLAPEPELDEDPPLLGVVLE